MNSRWTEPTSLDYEREAEATRHRLAESLDELTTRLTPGQLFDELLGYARGNGGTVLRSLANVARDNPLPSLLVGTGCALFLSDKLGLRAAAGKESRLPVRHSESSGSSMAGAEGVTSSVASGLRSAARLASSARSGLSQGAQRLAEAAANTTDRMAATKDDLTQSAAEAGEAVKDYSTEIAERISERAIRTKDQTFDVVRRAIDTATRATHEQPLVVGAVGLAIGAVIAAALPPTRTEDEILGEASDAVKKAAGEVAAEHYGAAKTAIGNVVEEAKETVAQQGFGAPRAAEAARDFADRIVDATINAGAASDTATQSPSGRKSEGKRS